MVYPSADEVTLERDGAAQREQHILEALGAGVAGDESASDLASIEAPAAVAHLDALGGVYLPTPSPAPSPSPFTDTLEAAVMQARDGALETAQTTADDNLAVLQSVMGLTHAFALWWAQDADVTPNPDPSPTASAQPVPTTVAERTLPSSVDLGDALVPSATDISPVILGELAVEHDKARFMYELIAARSTGNAQRDALARRDIHQARSNAFLALPDVADNRAVLYNIPLADVADATMRATTARDAELALGWRYAELLAGNADDHGWLLNAAFDAYSAGALLPGFEPHDFPVLPSLAVE